VRRQRLEFGQAEAEQPAERDRENARDEFGAAPVWGLMRRIHIPILARRRSFEKGPHRSDQPFFQPDRADKR
jgi:hypothetical protein